jgi:hypothetical protein
MKIKSVKSINPCISVIQTGYDIVTKGAWGNYGSGNNRGDWNEIYGFTTCLTCKGGKWKSPLTYSDNRN